MGLPEEHIFVEGIGGLKADKKGTNYITNYVCDIKPHIVPLKLGTNAIADSATTHFESLEQQVSHLIVQIHSICGELFCHSVKVLVCEVIEWHRFWGSTTLQEFNIKRDLYNKTLLFLSKQNSNIIFGSTKRKSLGIWKKGQ